MFQDFQLAFQHSNINIFIAFIAGFLTFFASCLLPLVPTYLAYLSGMSLAIPNSKDKKRIWKRELFLNGVLFTIGFIIIFVILGALAANFGRQINIYKPILQRIGGVFFIIMGFLMMGLIKEGFLTKEISFNFEGLKLAFLKDKFSKIEKSKLKKINSVIVGLTFGLAWTPCIGPILAVILFWASQAGSVLKGVWLLLAYGIGLGIPFVLIAGMFDKWGGNLKKLGKFSAVLQKIAGGIIILMGILLLINRVEIISLWLINLVGLEGLSI